MTLTIRPFPLSPIRLPWDALIEDFRWMEGFCDVQTRGPFAYWRHCHSVTPANNGTLLTDSVEYELPLGALGTFANWVFVRHQLAATFRFRQRRTLELLAMP
jgi:ligand-binding SRPBCC domain-containing protein